MTRASLGLFRCKRRELESERGKAVTLKPGSYPVVEKTVL